MAACQIGHIEVVTLLLSNGAEIHHRGEVTPRPHYSPPPN
jgi:ankyrin repeat protein